MNRPAVFLTLIFMLSGCVSLYRPVEPVKPTDELLSCDELHKEFMHFQKKESNIAADASSLTGNRYAEYLTLPLYFINPLLLIRGSGGPTHKISKAELSYICRQRSLLSLLEAKSCELRENEKARGNLKRCSVTTDNGLTNRSRGDGLQPRP